MSILKNIQAARAASDKLRSSTAKARKQALAALALALVKQQKPILQANARDIAWAKEQGLTAAMINRLTLTDKSIAALAKSVREIARQPEVVGEIIETTRRPNGLLIQRERIPLGVIAMIFESRPNVVIDCAALAIKSGNAIVLKGGKEARHSNAILGDVVRRSIKPYLPMDSVIVLDSTSRDAVGELLHLPQYIDVVIPRGGEGLVRYVTENARMPVIAHYKGLCHVYVHSDAKLADAVKIAVNAKAQRPGVCNAAETLLVHEKVAKTFLSKLIPEFDALQVEVRGCSKTKKLFPKVKAATAEDWDTEYLDRIISIKVVNGLDEAIAHIQRHGSHHTEAICAQTKTAIQRFFNEVDASCVVANASTRFNDGGELGLGAELGISTSKLHAYGPMGAREMTATRFVVHGKGQIRG